MIVEYTSKNVLLPLGFSKPKCSKCKRDVPGVLAYTGGPLEVDANYVVLELGTMYVCFVCRLEDLP